MERKFTEQRYDDTGLYYYGARYYDPEIGRFISPDTIVPDPTDPQSINRYSYCRNNPLKHVDPTGHDDEFPDNDGDGIPDWSWEWQWYASLEFLKGYGDFFYNLGESLLSLLTPWGRMETKTSVGYAILHPDEAWQNTCDYYLTLAETYRGQGQITGEILFTLGTLAAPFAEAGTGARASSLLSKTPNWVVKLENQLIKGTGGKISGFANDAGNIYPLGLEQIMTREGVGVSNKAIINAVNKPLTVAEQMNGNFLYMGKSANVVLQPDGRLVTAWATNKGGWRIVK